MNESIEKKLNDKNLKIMRHFGKGQKHISKVKVTVLLMATCFLMCLCYGLFTYMTSLDSKYLLSSYYIQGPVHGVGIIWVKSS